jgi:hypothetical protein
MKIMQDLGNWPNLIAAIATSFAAGFSALSIALNERSNSRLRLIEQENARIYRDSQGRSQQSAMLNRSIQTVIHCNQRYHELTTEIRSCLNSEDGDQAFHYVMTKYWSLKSDQFDYWLAGFVDHDAFFTWFSSACKHFAADDGLWPGRSFRDGWKIGRAYHQGINPWFVRFIDCLEKSHKFGDQINNEFPELSKIIDEMEGSTDSPGLARQFRMMFQVGMAWENYKNFTSKNGEFLANSFSRLCS